jgi:hypothetical protein
VTAQITGQAAAAIVATVYGAASVLVFFSIRIRAAYRRHRERRAVDRLLRDVFRGA